MINPKEYKEILQDWQFGSVPNGALPIKDDIAILMAIKAIRGYVNGNDKERPPDIKTFLDVLEFYFKTHGEKNANTS